MKRARWLVVLPLVLLLAACRPTGESGESAETTPSETASTETVSSEMTPTEQWDCRNDIEINCGEGACQAGDSFTPMDVRVDDAGAMSVCAYTGCWEGTGTVFKSENFVVVTGHDLPFSSAPDASGGQDIVIALDTSDLVAVLKAGSFAHPLLCEKSTP